MSGEIKRYIEKVKTIKGYKWHPEEKYWGVPYSKDNVEKIISQFNEEKVNIDQSLHLEEMRKYLDIRNYLFYLADEKDSSASTLNIAINALKFYYDIILKRKFVYEIKRPRKDKKYKIHPK